MNWKIYGSPLAPMCYMCIRYRYPRIIQVSALALSLTMLVHATNGYGASFGTPANDNQPPGTQAHANDNRAQATFSPANEVFTAPSVPLNLPANDNESSPKKLDANLEIEDAKQYASTSPKNLRAQAKRLSAKDIGTMSLKLGGEAVLFYAAAGLVAMRQIMTEGEANPAALETWWTKSATDPGSYLSFYLFAVGNRSTHWMLAAANADQASNVGIRRWQMNEMARSESARINHSITGKLPTPPPASPGMKVLGALHMPLGLSGGLLLSSIGTELFVTDHDLHRCVRSFWKSEMTLAELSKSQESCEVAYDTWSRRHRELYPELVSLLLSTGLQVAVTKAAPAILRTVGNKIGTGETTNLALRYLRISVAIAGRGTQAVMSTTPAGWVVFIGSTYLFLELDHIIGPPIKEWWNVRDKGHQLTKMQTEIQREYIRIQSSQFEDSLVDPIRHNEDLSNRTNHDWPLDRKLRDLSRLFQKYRSFGLAKVYETNSSWSTYMTDFVQTYTSAYNLNLILLGDLAEKRSGSRQDDEGQKTEPTKPGTAGAKQKLTLDDDLPFSYERLPSITAINELSESIDIWITQPAKLSVRLSKNENAILARINAGLKEIRETQNLLTNSKEMRRAVEALTEYLQLNGIAPRLLPIDHPLMMTWEKLGRPSPTRAGWAMLSQIPAFKPQEANTKSTLDDEQSQTPVVHPSRLGAHAQTPRFLDYLLAQMVCGPDINPAIDPLQESESVSAQLNTFESAPQAQDVSLVGRAINLIGATEFFGLSAKPTTPLSANEQITNARNKLFQEERGIRFSFLPPKIVRDSAVDFCNLMPNAGRVHTFSEPTAGTVLPSVHIHDGNWQVNGKTYEGFLDVIRDLARPELTKIISNPNDEDDKGNYSFVPWWNQNVVPGVRAVVQRLAGQFKKFVDEKYLPVLTTGEKETFNGREFAVGTLPSLANEFSFYLSMLDRAYVADLENSNIDAGKSARARNLLAELRVIHRAYARLFYSGDVRLHAFITLNKFETANGDNPLFDPNEKFDSKFLDDIRGAAMKGAFIVAKAQIANRLKELQKYEASIASQGLDVEDVARQKDSNDSSAQIENLAKLTAVMPKKVLNRMVVNSQLIENMQKLAEELEGYRSVLNSASPPGIDSL